MNLTSFGSLMTANRHTEMPPLKNGESEDETIYASERAPLTLPTPLYSNYSHEFLMINVDSQ